MKLFFTYLRQRRRVLGLLALFAAIFFSIFALYHLPMKAVAYPALLCAGVGGIILVWDFLRLRSKHRKLSRMTALSDVLSLGMPEPLGIEEQDYQRIIDCLTDEQKELRQQWSGRYRDMVEYYTVWAHQIKTPIASMRLNLQNEDSALSRSLMQDLFRVEQYVDMVMVFLRLENSASDYVIREYRLDAIIKQAVKKYAGEFIARKLTLHYEPVDTTVVTDEKWLSFVVEQVLSNALKYTPQGSITITVEPQKRLCIRDTGIGIAPEDLPRVFENGYTGCNGRTDKRASGIGLYLCRRICRNLGHGISVRSEVDKGTCICIDLEQRPLQVD